MLEGALHGYAAKGQGFKDLFLHPGRGREGGGWRLLYSRRGRNPGPRRRKWLRQECKRPVHHAPCSSPPGKTVGGKSSSMGKTCSSFPIPRSGASAASGLLWSIRSP